ncbi:hypothetical protein B0H19DRAFT_1074646 [Mycena capillaripes]|nr:hypothetical protein B0H19DRAFT_1074646 [Mycena capillaripes]
MVKISGWVCHMGDVFASELYAGCLGVVSFPLRDSSPSSAQMQDKKEVSRKRYLGVCMREIQEDSVRHSLAAWRAEKELLRRRVERNMPCSGDLRLVRISFNMHGKTVTRPSLGHEWRRRLWKLPRHLRKPAVLRTPLGYPTAVCNEKIKIDDTLYSNGWEDGAWFSACRVALLPLSFVRSGGVGRGLGSGACARQRRTQDICVSPPSVIRAPRSGQASTATAILSLHLECTDGMHPGHYFASVEASDPRRRATRGRGAHGRARERVIVCTALVLRPLSPPAPRRLRMRNVREPALDFSEYGRHARALWLGVRRVRDSMRAWAGSTWGGAIATPPHLRAFYHPALASLVERVYAVKSQVEAHRRPQQFLLALCFYIRPTILTSSSSCVFSLLLPAASSNSPPPSPPALPPPSTSTSSSKFATGAITGIAVGAVLETGTNAPLPGNLLRQTHTSTPTTSDCFTAPHNEGGTTTSSGPGFAWISAGVAAGAGYIGAGYANANRQNNNYYDSENPRSPRRGFHTAQSSTSSEVSVPTQTGGGTVGLSGSSGRRQEEGRRQAGAGGQTRTRTRMQVEVRVRGGNAVCTAVHS